MNELTIEEKDGMQKKNGMSLQDVAKQLCVSYDTIQRHSQKLGFTSNGKKTYLNEKQITLLLEDIQKTNNRTDLPSTTVIEGTSTTLTPALKIKRAMELMREGYEEELQILRSKLIEQTPKVEFYDAVTGSSDCIEMKEVAKILNIKDMGRNKLFEILRNKKILDRNNQPYQKYVDAGLFRIVESKYCVNGDVRINLKTVVFQKGIDFIKKIIGE